MNATPLAKEFARRLWLAIGEDTAVVIARNRAEGAGNVCHSHDFIDANDVMAEAFEAVVGRPIDLQAQADVALWDAAWAEAKASEFATA